MGFLERNSILFFFSLFFLMSCTSKEPLTTFESNDRVSIKVFKGSFLVEDRNQKNILIANAGITSDWCKFFLFPQNDSIIAIRGSSANYLSYNDSSNVLYATAKTIGKTEKFILTPHKQYFTLKTLNGDPVTINDQLQLIKTSSGKEFLFEIKSYSTIPESWFSITEIKWANFFNQFIPFIIIILLLGKYLFKHLKNKFSIGTTIILSFLLVYSSFDIKSWEDNNVIQSDAVVYYEYLPAAFIFNDLSFEFEKKLPTDFNGTIWLGTAEATGNRLPITSMGAAILYSPFFFLGHLVAKTQGYTTYGYSKPYSKMLALGCLLYVVIALFYLRKVLLLFFNDAVTSFTLISIVLATNLFYYTVREPGMSHSYSFFLITMFLWFTIKWHHNKNWKTAVILGLFSGLVALLRPTNVLIVFVFVFYGITSWSSLKNKFLLFWNYKIHIGIIFLFAIIVWVPQFLFWKNVTGVWFYNSYDEASSFYFNNPRILDGLFSYRKGWLLYTPVMAFALLGIGFLYKMQKQWFFPILIFTGFNIYVMFSWWCWWYGGGFGMRPMVDSYALMAIPLAAFYSYFDKISNYLKTVPVIIVLITISLNLFQTQQTRTCLHWDSMTKETYLSNFSRLGWFPGIDEILSPPDYEKAMKGLDEYEESFFEN